ncbi:hypothetical protein ACJRO7_021534 [Eucalyptus globulus]|uniref:Bulb-type lectin domain-containing protein n=1 Tax=Eucalyptus globulus TaxID=34317 RepID=A0ABD3KK48_EUCGL
MIYWCSCLVIFCLLQASHRASGVAYNITPLEPLFLSQTLASSGNMFELGFFRPSGSENRYVGIWYKNLTPSKILWVANRERPLVYTDQSAKLTIGSDGNLKLMDGQENIVWSTNVSSRSNYTLAALLDSGNFVLQDGNYSEIWGSFEDPTDTLLPTMKIGVNVRTGVKGDYISDIGDEEGCESWCRSSCSCLAYSYVSTIGCMLWSKDLNDIEEFPTAGEDLFVRVASVKAG